MIEILPASQSGATPHAFHSVNTPGLLHISAGDIGLHLRTALVYVDCPTLANDVAQLHVQGRRRVSANHVLKWDPRFRIESRAGAIVDVRGLLSTAGSTSQLDHDLGLVALRCQ